MEETTEKNAQLQLYPPLLPPLDMLSSLPDPILADILSLLPTQTAVSTSVLSHRWRCLWTQLTSLHLDSYHFSLHRSEFYTIIDQFLTRLTSPFLRTFSLIAPYPSHQHFDPWLRTLCSRHVQKIHIAVDSPYDDACSTYFTLPSCIFRTQSLVCLQLPYVSPDYDLPQHPNVLISLPNLTKLELIFGASQCGFVAKLVRSCPLLEDLTVTASQTCIKASHIDAANGDLIDISSGSLKHLVLFLSWAVNAKVMIDAPKLDCLALYALRLASCSFVNKPIALRFALISISKQSQYLVLSLLPGISDVAVLDMPGKNFGMFVGCKDDQGKSFMFRNLTELRLNFGHDIVDCLGGFSFEITSPSLLLHLKRIRISVSQVKHENNFNKLAEYLLSNAPSLEKLTFLVGTHSSQTEGMLGINLDLFSRNFPRCLIEFSKLAWE